MAVISSRSIDGIPHQKLAQKAAQRFWKCTCMYENGGFQFVDRSMIRDVNAAQNIVRVGIAQRKEAGRELPELQTTVSWIQLTKKSEANAL
jgi:hypothetical protein